MLRALFFRKEPASPARPADRRRARNSRYQVRLATTPRELEQADRLVHARYLRLGYRSPERAKAPCPLHAQLPSTHTFVGVAPRVDTVVATVSLVVDGPFGLPMDKVYGAELDALRGGERRLAEITCLATRRRGDSRLLLRLYRAVYTLARYELGVTDLCIAVHPRHGIFYRRALLFQRLGPVRSYPDCNDAPAVGLRLELSSAGQRYRGAHGLGRLGRFLFGQRDDREVAARLAADLDTERAARRRVAESQPCPTDAHRALRGQVLLLYGRDHDVVAAGGSRDQRFRI